MLDIERSPERVKLDWGKNLYLRRGTTVQLKKPRVVDGKVKPSWITLGRLDEGMTKEQAIALAYQHSAGEVQVEKRNVRARDAWREIFAMHTNPDTKASLYWTPNTAKTQQQRWENHCEEILGSLWMKQIDQSHIQQIYKRMRERGYVRGGVKRDYAPLTITGVEDTLSGFFTTAMHDPFNFVVSNPVIAVGANRPDRERENGLGPWVVMSDEEVDALCRGIGGDKFTRRITEENFRFAHGTGVRISEGLACTWDRIDLQQGTVLVDRQLQRHFSVKNPVFTWLSGTKYSRKGKVGSRYRVLPLFDGEWERLRAYREWLLSVGLYRGPESFVFPARTHHPLRQPELQRRFREALDASGIVRGEEEGLHYHCLRHTYASKRFASGMTLEKVSRLLGHSDVRVTRDSYVRLMDDAVQAEVEADRELERAWQERRKLRAV